MQFLLPYALAGMAAAVGGLVAAYLLRARFRRRPVSSLMLWSALAPASGAGRRRDRLRTPPLFFLELAALVCLALAAASPFVRRGAPPAPTLALADSASMAARDPDGVTPASRAAADLSHQLGDAAHVRVILATVPAPQSLGLLPRADALALLRDPSRFLGNGDSLDSALALAETLRAEDGAILVATDRAPPPDRPLPPGSRWLAFGRPLPNAALSARRALSDDGSEALLLSVQRFPATDEPLTATIETVPAPPSGDEAPEVPFAPRTVRLSPAETTVIPLPTHCPTLRVALPEDALAADNAAVLSTAAPPPVPVETAFADATLSDLARRAVAATGLAARGGTGDATPDAPRVLLTDDPARFRAHRYGPALLFVPPPANPRVLAGPWLCDGADQLLEGLDFTGLAWSLPPADAPSPLPGTSLAWCAGTPVLTTAAPGAYALLAPPPGSPFFRSTAWPSLVYNLLDAGHPENGGSSTSAATPHDADLTACATLRLDGPPARPSIESGAIRPIAGVFGLAALLLVILRIALPRALAGSRVRIALAAATLALLAAALARPVVRIRRNGGMLVVVADRSASLPPEERQAEQRMIDAIHRRRSEGGSLAVVSFGERAAIEQPPSAAPFAGFRLTPGEDASDLDAAIDAALSVVPPREPARILVLSDGQANGPDPRGSSAKRAAARGVPIDVRLLASHRSDDLAIARLDAPAQLRPGEPLLATAWITAPAPQTVTYALLRDGHPVSRGMVDLPAGLTPLRFRDAPRPEGVSGYVVSVFPTDGGGNDAPSAQRTSRDAVPENNTARFLVTRTGSRPLLVIPASPDSHLPALLRGAGLDIAVREPRDIDFAPGALAGWSGVLIENRRADAFGAPALRDIAAWVEHAGGGLALTGGRNAFGPGGWHKTPVEDILPVSLELRRDHRKFPMAIAVALDRSGSMMAPAAGHGPHPAGKGVLTKMDLADQATAGVLDMLADNDEIAVIAVDSSPHVVVPLRDAASARGDRKRILSIESMGGGIFVGEALAAGLAELRKSSAPIRHLLLFADAADSEEPTDYRELLAVAREAGITTSVVGLGSEADSDADLLQEVAALGDGLCAFSDDPHEIPKLFAHDTILAARDVLVTNPVPPLFTAALPQLSDRIPLDGAPALGGYDLCYLRPGATAVAITADDNAAPVVALRPVGAGRTAVFTGEVDGEFSGPFARWPHAAELHAALARFTAGAQDSPLAGYIVVPRLAASSLELSLYPPSPGGAPEASLLRSLRLSVLRSTPHGGSRVESVPLEWAAADRLAASIPLRGGETALPVIADDATGAVRPLPAARLPYSPEFAPDAAGRGEAVLSALADLTGGRRLADPSEAWSGLPRPRVPLELAPAFYLLAALALLLDIFDRRTAFLSARLARVRPAPRPAELPTSAADPSRGRAEGTAAPRPAELPTSAAAPSRGGAEGTAAPRPAELPTCAAAPSGGCAQASAFARARRRAASRTRPGT